MEKIYVLPHFEYLKKYVIIKFYWKKVTQSLKVVEVRTFMVHHKLQPRNYFIQSM